MTSFIQQRQCEWSADFEVPSGSGFIALLEAFRVTGGTAPDVIVGRLLEEHQVGNAVSLAKLIDSGQAFGFEWRGSLWIPMFQFNANGLVLKADAQSVRAELPSLWSGWTLATWFAGPNARMNGRSPAEVLDSDLDAVMRAARSRDSGGGFLLPPMRRTHQAAAQV